jgi:DNA-binding XRE family transcriptional regulator
MAGKPDLRGRNFLPCGDQHLAGNPHDPFPWPNTGTGWHLRNSFTCHVRSNRRKIPIRHLKDLRAIKPGGALQPTILSQTSNKHNFVFRLNFAKWTEFGSNIPILFAIVKGLKPPRNIVGPVIRELREEKGLTQAQFVAKLNVLGWDLSRETFAKIEYRIRWVADFEILKLAEAVGIEGPELLRRAAKAAKKP